MIAPLVFLCAKLILLQPASSEVTVIISDVTRKQGTILVCLVDNKKDFMKECLKDYAIQPQIDSTVLVIPDLPHGRYAITLFQDVNENGQLDRRFWGYPAEPFGLSNHSGILLGPPRFGHCAFPVDSKQTRVEIRMRR